jgi:hypothetical protein
MKWAPGPSHVCFKNGGASVLLFCMHNDRIGPGGWKFVGVAHAPHAHAPLHHHRAVATEGQQASRCRPRTQVSRIYGLGVVRVWGRPEPRPRPCGPRIAISLGPDPPSPPPHTHTHYAHTLPDGGQVLIDKLYCLDVYLADSLSRRQRRGYSARYAPGGGGAARAPLQPVQPMQAGGGLFGIGSAAGGGGLYGGSAVGVDAAYGMAAPGSFQDGAAAAQQAAKRQRLTHAAGLEDERTGRVRWESYAFVS